MSDNAINVPIYEVELVYDGGFSGKLSAETLGVTQTSYKYKGKTSEAIKTAQITVDKLNATIDLKVSQDDIISSINLSPEAIRINTAKLNIDAYVTFTNLSTSGQTTINGGNITTNSIDASKITVTNLSSINSNLGSITGGSININSGAFIVTSGGAVTATSATITGTVNANSGRIGNVTFTSGTGSVSMSGNLDIDGNITAVGSIASYSILPRANNTYSLGTSSFRWLSIWQQSGSVTGSDRTLKKDIMPIENGIDFILNLKPVQYKYIDGGSGRNHYGFIAQEVKEALTLSNIEDSAVFVNPIVKEDVDDENGKKLALRYDEFISPLVMTVQSLEKRIKELENGKAI
jgi:hypothetical protein